MIPYLFSGWAFLRAFLYIFVVSPFLGEEEFYLNPSNRKSMSIFVHLRICPHPDLSMKERKQWASSWWLYGIAAVAIALLTFIVGEILLH